MMTQRRETSSSMHLLLAVTLLLSISFFTSGCALFGLWYRVDRSTLDVVPNEEKLLLFDAENGVYIAKDEIEVARRARGDAEKALARAERYDDVIDERRASGASIDTPDVLALLEEWNASRVSMREMEVEVAEQKMVTAESRLWASRARYERAKATLVKDHAPEEGTDIDVADFDGQVADYEIVETEELAALKALEDELSARRAAYNEKSTALQVLSKGAYGGPWADLVD